MDHPEGQDDMTLGLHIQQFLDEWFYRVLHANLSSKWDREATLLKALELFEAGGATRLPDEERLALANLEYEDELVAAVVKIIPPPLRRNMEHFLLQVQLVLSTATRVRMCLEEGTSQEIAKAMEDGDPGITQQILKQVVVKAVREVAGVLESKKSWEHVMDVRTVRLARCADEAVAAAKELDCINRELSVFGGNQNEKSKKMVMGILDGQDKLLLKTILGYWIGVYSKFVRHRDVHDRFRKQLEDAEKRLVDYKLYSKGNVHGVMNRKNMATNEDLLREVIGVWVSWVAKEKEDRELGGQIAATNEKLSNMKAAQKDNAKSAMIRVCSGNDSALVNMCYDAWARDVADEKKNKDFNDAVREAEAGLKAYMQKKKDEARGVLNKMTGSSDSGLIFQTFTSWADEYRSVKKGRELEGMIEQQKSKFSTLNARQKGAGYNTVARANQLEDETIVMHIFMNWVHYAKVEFIIKHYDHKIDKKKNQLEQVQTLFKSFATQLEQGIGNTPRSQRTKQAKPPLQPAA